MDLTQNFYFKHSFIYLVEWQDANSCQLYNMTKGYLIDAIFRRSEIEANIRDRSWEYLGPAEQEEEPHIENLAAIC